MLKIAVCDDEQIFCNELKNIISTYMLEKQICYEIDLFRSGKDFVRHGAEMIKYQIIFLDINMDDLNGIETAKALRCFCKDTFIVFVTAFVDYTVDGYMVEAFRYILKSNQNFKETVYESLDAICNKMNCIPNVERFEFKECTKEISLDRIAYIESNLHKLEFNVLEEKYVVYSLYDTLNSIEEKYNKNGFLRIHQSYLVNMKYITNIVNYKAYIINGIVLPVAKSRFKFAKDKFVKYKGEI